MIMRIIFSPPHENCGCYGNGNSHVSHTISPSFASLREYLEE